MRKAKASQVQRIANLEKIMSQMYLKIEAFKIKVDQLEKMITDEKENSLVVYNSITEAIFIIEGWEWELISLGISFYINKKAGWQVLGEL